MIPPEHWQSGLWGVVKSLFDTYTSWAQTYVSIATIDTPMAVYQSRSYGLAFHITSQYDTWKYFQVQGHGHDAIVGGPGDGGSHTPESADWRLTMKQAGKDFQWFDSQKRMILAKYNTVYKVHDYNEFIINGVPDSAVVGVFHYEGGQEYVSDNDLCSFLNRNVRNKPPDGWPVYGYNYQTSRSDEKASLRIEKHIHCSRDVVV